MGAPSTNFVHKLWVKLEKLTKNEFFEFFFKSHF
jgi:hypothetical protein